MKQSEIRIIYQEKGIAVQAQLEPGLKHSALLEGLIAHLSAVAQALKSDESEILFFMNMLHRTLEENPDAMRKESVEIKIPKGLNLSGKEEQ